MFLYMYTVRKQEYLADLFAYKFVMCKKVFISTINKVEIMHKKIDMLGYRNFIKYNILYHHPSYKSRIHKILSIKVVN